MSVLDQRFELINLITSANLNDLKNSFKPNPKWVYISFHLLLDASVLTAVWKIKNVNPNLNEG